MSLFLFFVTSLNSCRVSKYLTKAKSRSSFLISKNNKFSIKRIQCKNGEKYFPFYVIVILDTVCVLVGQNPFLGGMNTSFKGYFFVIKLFIT